MMFVYLDAYIKKTKTITETAKPEDFTNKVKWIEWYPTFINFLRAILESSGVPLSYIYRPTNVIMHITYGYFIDDYVYRSPLTRKAHLTNPSEAHTLIIKFTSGNPA